MEKNEIEVETSDGWKRKDDAGNDSEYKYRRRPPARTPYTPIFICIFFFHCRRNGRTKFALHKYEPATYAVVVFFSFSSLSFSFSSFVVNARVHPLAVDPLTLSCLLPNESKQCLEWKMAEHNAYGRRWTKIEIIFKTFGNNNRLPFFASLQGQTNARATMLRAPIASMSAIGKASALRYTLWTISFVKWHNSQRQLPNFRSERDKDNNKFDQRRSCFSFCSFRLHRLNWEHIFKCCKSYFRNKNVHVILYMRA